MQAGVQGLPTQNTFLRHIKTDLKSIGFHGLNTQVFRENDITNPAFHCPCARRHIRLGREIKSVKPQHALTLCGPSVHLPQRIIKRHRHRMLTRQPFRPIVEHEREMQRVTRTPNAPLAINKSLDALLHPFARNIKRTKGQRRTIIYPEIGAFTFGRSHQIIGLSLHFQACPSFRVGLA